jgi:hypothetical protein
MYVSLLPYKHISLTLVLACLVLAKACDVAAPDEWHHNAGVDARDSLASVVIMMLEYPGVRLPTHDCDLPILVSVDL